MADDNSIIEQLEAVSQAFKMQLPEKGAEITKQWALINNDAQDLTALDALYRLIHNLAGAGGTFGFNRITDLARQITGPLRVALNDPETGLMTAERTKLNEPITQLIELCMNPCSDAQKR